jgi:hypothetical protein
LIVLLATEHGLHVIFEFHPLVTMPGQYQLRIGAKRMREGADAQYAFLYRCTMHGYQLPDLLSKMYWGLWDIWQQAENAAAGPDLWSVDCPAPRI